METSKKFYSIKEVAGVTRRFKKPALRKSR